MMGGQEIMKKKQNAFESLAARLQIDSENLQKILMATVCKDIKTNEQFVTFVAVANQYCLNPLTKEIYAFQDKGGGVVPIVSTDGWTRLMVNHLDYRSHSFRYSEGMVTLHGGKPCPEWCEIVITKKDNSEIVVREYLDEVFRDLNYSNPWQTHTKRMLRHKTKIQGAREAFGFGGIYDQDEAERLIEAESIGPEMNPARPAMPQPKIATKETQGSLDPSAEPTRPLEEKNPSPNTSMPLISDAQCKRFFAKAKTAKKTDMEIREYLKKEWGINSSKQIQKSWYDVACNWAQDPSTNTLGA